MWLTALSALAIGLASAQSAYERACFGQTGRISSQPDEIPSWDMSGGGDWRPQLMSDRVILTPPDPGNRQGALWTDSRIPLTQWSVDFEFRASGPERGAGNLQIWYTKENQAVIGTSSVYTVRQFQGLALVVDMSGGTGGAIRGFLNDGSIDYANHHHIEGLAFGHCDYSYRNLGRPTKLTLKQDSTGFEVSVDGRECFRSNSVLLPANNFFGVTAASSETPDSFEVFKFVTTALPQQGPGSGSTPPREHHERAPYPEQGQQQQKIMPAGDFSNKAPPPPSQGQGQADTLASSIRDQQAQFVDLHDRLQSLARSVDNLLQETQRLSGQLQTRMEELEGPLAKAQQVGSVEGRVAKVEGILEEVRRAQEKQFKEIHGVLEKRHDVLMDSLPENMGKILSNHAPNMKLFLFLIVAFQLVLAAAYVVYKRRINSGPKKYL